MAAVAVDGGCADGEKIFDLGKDSDQGFPEVQNLLISSEEQRNAEGQLSQSIHGEVENVARGEKLVSSIFHRSGNQSIDCLLNVLKVFAERCEPKFDDADILELAMRPGRHDFPSAYLVASRVSA